MNAVRNSTAGFTLIELLIAIFIFGIVVSAVYGAYNASFTVINGTEKHLNESHKARAAMQRITEDLEAVVTGPGGYLAGEENEYGGNRGDSLSFISSTHVLFRESDKLLGNTLVTYTAELDDETQTLRLLRSDTVVYPGGETTSEGSTKFLLCKGLKAVEFTYFSPEGDESSEWVSDEEEADEEEVTNPSLPALVVIELTFASEGESETESGGTYTTAVAVSEMTSE